MAVPDFQSLMLPLLCMATDGHEHSLAVARDRLAADFKLSDADREELLPSGRQPRFSNRVAWAKVYLQQAGLLVSPRRGHFQITARGLDVLKSPPPRINIKFLEQYQEFVKSRTPKGGEHAAPPARGDRGRHPRHRDGHPADAGRGDGGSCRPAGCVKVLTDTHNCVHFYTCRRLTALAF